MPRTVWLYTPASHISRMQKAVSLPVDCLIFDLEDSVPPAEKETARENVAKCLSTSSYRTVEIGVRINGLGTEFGGQDIRHLAPLRPDFFVLPKVESEQAVKDFLAMLFEIENQASPDQEKIEIFCIIETARGIVNLEKIVFASERLNGIMFGAEDFTLDLGIERSREGKELFYARAKVAICAAAARMEAIDTVFSDIEDREGVIAEAIEAFMMGFTGKAIIHPSQIEPVRLGFSPSQEKVEIAKKQIAEFERGLERGVASVSVDGEMVDYPVYRRAKKMVALAESLQKGGPKR